MRTSTVFYCESCNICMRKEDKMFHMCKSGGESSETPRFSQISSQKSSEENASQNYQNMIQAEFQAPIAAIKDEFSQRIAEKYPNLVTATWQKNKKYFCEICLVHATDASRFHLHMIGVKHLKKLKQNFHKCNYECGIWMLREEAHGHACGKTKTDDHLTNANQALSRPTSVQTVYAPLPTTTTQISYPFMPATTNPQISIHPALPPVTRMIIKPTTITLDEKVYRVSQKIGQMCAINPLDDTYICELCQIRCSDLAQFKLHMSGIKHTKKLKMCLHLCETCNIWMTRDEKTNHICNGRLEQESSTKSMPQSMRMVQMAKRFASTGVLAEETDEGYLIYSPVFSVEPLLKYEEDEDGWLKIGDWIEFNHENNSDGQILVKDYNKIDAKLTTRQFNGTIQLKIDLKIPEDYESYSYEWRIPVNNFIKDIYDLDDLIDPRKHCDATVKVVAERGKWKGPETKWKIVRILPTV